MAQDSVRSYYEELEPKFEEYKGIKALSERGVHAEVVETTKDYLQTGARVLDVGCGRGALALRLHDAGYEVEGCDIFDLCECKDQIKFTHTSAEEAHFDGLFDAVFLVEFLIAVEAPFTVMRQYAPYIKPGGHLIISSANIDADSSRIEYFLRGRKPYFEAHNVDNDGALNPLHDFQFRYMFKELALEPRLRRTILPFEAPPAGFGWAAQRLLATYRKLGRRQGGGEDDGRIAIYVAQKSK
jgi:SAM-dependent methyltransferase